MRVKISDCKYNPGVGCEDPVNCGRCGWAPETDRRRREARSGSEEAEKRKEDARQ